MNRAPQYTKDGNHRIVSIPNGGWRLQRASERAASRTFDPWLNMSHPVDFASAQHLLRARETQCSIG